MRINILFAMLTLIVVIIVIMSTDSLLTAIVIIGLLLNFLAVGSQIVSNNHSYLSMSVFGHGKVSEDSEETSVTSVTSVTTGDNSVKDTVPLKKRLHGEEIPEITENDQNTNLYGRQQEEYDSYINSYTSAYPEPKPVVFASCSERDNSIDGANAIMAQKRARDKKCIDGKIVKDVNHYRHHYAAELEESENKVWWGANEH